MCTFLIKTFNFNGFVAAKGVLEYFQMWKTKCLCKNKVKIYIVYKLIYAFFHTYQINIYIFISLTITYHNIYIIISFWNMNLNKNEDILNSSTCSNLIHIYIFSKFLGQLHFFDTKNKIQCI